MPLKHRESEAYQRLRTVNRGWAKVTRKPKPTPQQQKEARRREGGEAIRDVAATYNVHNSTISRL